LRDGRSLNREMLRLGLAWWFRQYAPTDSDLQRLQREARQAGRGLWADSGAVPPWEWRADHRPRAGSRGQRRSEPRDRGRARTPTVKRIYLGSGTSGSGFYRACSVH
jgi:hypothetical protein